MGKVAIVGGGFAGTAAARVLKGGDLEVHLYDPKTTFDFLPLLPDALGGRYSNFTVTQEYRNLAQRYGFVFHEEHVTSIDPKALTVTADKGTRSYDYIIAATGALTNYFGNEEAARNAFPLRRMSQVLSILEELEENNIETVVVVGGGYTGLETASQLRRYARKNKTDLDIVIVELKDSILPMREDWEREYMAGQMSDLGVKIKTGCTVDSFGEEGVRLTDGEEIPRCTVIWNAGVRITNPFVEGSVERDDKGQIKTDRFLRAAPGCYAVGDLSRVEKDGKLLPMASYFSVQQGKAAARNILRAVRGKKLKPYRPRDYGLVIPLANGRGCGRLLGIKVTGTFAAIVHHTASYFRSHDGPSRRSMIRELFREGLRL